MGLKTGFKRFFAKVKRLQRPLVRVIQRVILAVCLFLLYYIGFGLSRLLMTVLGRRTLYNKPRRKLEGNTFWRDAEGYDLDEERLTQQS